MLVSDADSSYSAVAISDKDGDIIRPAEQEEAEKHCKPAWWMWWYLFIIPVAPAAALVVFIFIFRQKYSPNWELPQADDLRSDATCYLKYHGTFDRHFIMDITYGNYPFVAAKAIDVAWNTIIGEGGRFLHAYILYRHVARGLLVWLMEYSSVTYSDYIAITFSQSVSGGLVVFLGLVFRRHKFPALLCLIGILYMLLYTILLPTIWGGATGYLSPAQRTYHMPDNSYTSIDSERLALCWSIDSTRIGLPGGRVELGPNFSQLQRWLAMPRKKGIWTGIYELDGPDARSRSDSGRYLHAGGGQPKPLEDFGFNGWDRNIWDDIGPAGMGLGIEVSDAFKDIFEYAFTRRILQVAFNASGSSIAGYDTEIQLPLTSQPGSINLEFYWYNITTDVLSLDSLPASLEGKEYKYVNWTKKSQDDVQYVEYFNTWPMIALPASYTLNESVLLEPGIIPYNSTISLEGKTHSLEAPFLDIGHECSHPLNYLTALGNCVCYNGVPLTNDWYRDENVVCLYSSLYTWGFSSYIVYLGLLCETIWILFALWIRGYCQRWCTLMGHARVKKAGIVRGVLELAEAVTRDLGGDVALTEEAVLYRRLERCDNIGYAADRDEFGNLQAVRIISKCRGKKDLETNQQD